MSSQLKQVFVHSALEAVLVRVVGDGNNHWPLVDDRDLGNLYARLLEEWRESRNEAFQHP